MKALTMHFATDGRWVTNILVPILCVCGIAFVRAKRCVRGPSLYAANAVLVFAGLFAILAGVDLLTAEAFEFPPMSGLHAGYSAVPVFLLLDLIGCDQCAPFVTKHLVILSGMLTWGSAGWIVGASASSLFGQNGRKTAQPGATDNPDDAQ